MQLLRLAFLVILALAGDASVVGAQVVPQRPLHPTLPVPPLGEPPPDGGGDGEGDGAFLLFMVLCALVVLVPVLISRVLDWKARRRFRS